MGIRAEAPSALRAREREIVLRGEVRYLRGFFAELSSSRK
jgi:hypothetical protein